MQSPYVIMNQYAVPLYHYKSTYIPSDIMNKHAVLYDIMNQHAVPSCYYELTCSPSMSLYINMHSLYAIMNQHAVPSCHYESI